MRWDVHNHAVPREAVELLRESDGYPIKVEGDLMEADRVLAELTPVFSDPAAKLEQLAEAGLDAAVVSVSPALFAYETNGDRGGAPDRDRSARPSPGPAPAARARGRLHPLAGRSPAARGDGAAGAVGLPARPARLLGPDLRRPDHARRRRAPLSRGARGPRQRGDGNRPALRHGHPGPGGGAGGGRGRGDGAADHGGHAAPPVRALGRGLQRPLQVVERLAPAVLVRAHRLLVPQPRARSPGSRG